MTKRRTITARLAREMLDYDPETGVFTWKVAAGKVKAGAIAGSVGAHGYPRVGICGHQIGLHRVAFLIMTGSFPSGHIDHINRDRSDNRWGNLRLATPSQNQQNRTLAADNTTGFKGVSFDKTRNKYVALIKHGGKRVNLGRSDDPRKCAVMYDAAAVDLYGEFAATNSSLGLL